MNESTITKSDIPRDPWDDALFGDAARSMFKSTVSVPKAVEGVAELEIAKLPIRSEVLLPKRSLLSVEVSPYLMKIGVVTIVVVVFAGGYVWASGIGSKLEYGRSDQMAAITNASAGTDNLVSATTTAQ